MHLQLWLSVFWGSEASCARTPLHLVRSMQLVPELMRLSESFWWFRLSWWIGPRDLSGMIDTQQSIAAGQAGQMALSEAPSSGTSPGTSDWEAPPTKSACRPRSSRQSPRSTAACFTDTIIKANSSFVRFMSPAAESNV